MEVTFKMIAKTFAGLEETLAKELQALGAKNIETLKRAVSFEGDKELMYACNLELRTALRILVPLDTFQAKTEDEFYDFLRNQVDWTKYMDLMDTFAIDAVVNSTIFTHSQYIRHKTKDAIADFFKAKFRRRPNVNAENPHITYNIHISETECTLSLDSSGEVLSRRGYRTEANTAPLNEALAAGLILLADWDKETSFLDPMCGSGTILIEAAMIANNIAPNTLRNKFGFTQWKDFDRKLWRAVRRNAKRKETKNPVEIMGADVSEPFIKIAEKNIERANLSHCIDVDQISFQQTEGFDEKGLIIINPPYGERLIDEQEEVNDLYEEIGDTLKTYYSGYEAWILSSNDEAFKHIGLKTSQKVSLYNGSLDCNFNQYELYEGSKKEEYEV
ncbi:MAG: class I SAM-dependent RNA methyltransferase [Cytophagales bacterium]|nr:class I SAM-dependent RNA methyltransferase [Cytophagales bacterium]